MTVYETIISRRSIRRYDQNRPIPYEILQKCADAGRLAPSARNLQPLEYVVVDAPDQLAEVFETIQWGGFALEGKVEEGKRATAYIAIVVNKEIRNERYDHDVGIAAENIVLTAVETGLGTCMFTSVQWDKLREILSIPDKHDPVLVISMGYPDEAPVAEDRDTGEMTYFKDEAGVLHIPKRKLEDVMHRNKF